MRTRDLNNFSSIMQKLNQVNQGLRIILDSSLIWLGQTWYIITTPLYCIRYNFVVHPFIFIYIFLTMSSLVLLQNLHPHYLCLSVCVDVVFLSLSFSFSEIWWNCVMNPAIVTLSYSSKIPIFIQLKCNNSCKCNLKTHQTGKKGSYSNLKIKISKGSTTQIKLIVHITASKRACLTHWTQ